MQSIGALLGKEEFTADDLAWLVWHVSAMETGMADA